MPSLIDIRRRIRSVKNTEQITKALKMVSAAKLRRAQDRVIASRPYVALLGKVLANVATAIEANAADAADGASEENPLLARRPERRVLLVLITSDTGKAGAFNTNLIKAAQRFTAERPDAAVTLETVGRKAAPPSPANIPAWPRPLTPASPLSPAKPSKCSARTKPTPST